MVTPISQPHLEEAEELSQAPTPKAPNIFEGMRNLARSKIAATALTVSTAVATILGHESTADANTK